MAFCATTQPEAARRFYEGTLGLRFIAEEPFALVFDSNGTMLRVSKVKSFAALPFTVLGWRVEDITSAVRKLRAAGATFDVFEGLPHDEDRISEFPDGTRVAWFKDPDGNILSLTQFANGPSP